jgi:Zn-dependent protease
MSVVWLLMLIPSITFHEFMHGWAAYKLGDPTAKNAGRLTLNPIASVDPFGTILLPLAGFMLGGPIFGYAKPVPYDPRYFKNLRQGEVIVGLAGPAANLVLALLGAGMVWAGVAFLQSWATLGSAIVLVGFAMATANLVLMFFNLIPIPPLDGSSVVPLFLPDSMIRSWYEIQRYAIGIFILLIFGLPYIASFLGFPGVSPLGWYIEHTAFAVLRLILPAGIPAAMGIA